MDLYVIPDPSLTEEADPPLRSQALAIRNISNRTPELAARGQLKLDELIQYPQNKIHASVRLIVDETENISGKNNYFIYGSLLSIMIT